MTEDLERRIAEIEARNSRVEGDKAWEGSWTRRAFIAIITYLAALFLLSIVGAEHIFLAGLVPVVGFVLSTLTLPILKRSWLKKRGE